MMKRLLSFNYLKDRKGNSSIVLMFMIVIIVAFMSTTVDAGLLYLEKSKLQNTVDAAALAAIAVYASGQEKMLEEAGKYSNLNGIPSENLTIAINETNRKITVSTKKSVALYFARIFGTNSFDVEAKATAITGPVSAIRGIRPFGVEDLEFVYGETYTLKNGGGSGMTGNYGALALGGTGASNYRSNLSNGYKARLIKVGDSIETETGNMTGATYDGIREILDSDPNVHSEDLSVLEPGCIRVIKIPIVDSFSVEGRSTVTVVGFASFFLEDVNKNGGHTEIKGRFLKKITEGEIDESGVGYGLFGTKLIE